MRVVNALMVDEIRDREDGGVDLIGLREDLYFDAVPVILQTLTLFVEVGLTPEDRGRNHTLEFRLVEGATERVMRTASLRFTIAPNHPRPTAPLDPTLFELPFERFGPYYLEIWSNGEPDRRLMIQALQREG